MRVSLIISVFVAVSVVAMPAIAADGNGAIGNWKHPDNGAIVAFYDCDGDLCAKIATPSDPALKDDKNPDPAKRAVPLTGLMVLNHAKKSDGTAWKGDLYNTEDGKTYSGYATMLAADKLQLKGCALVIFCKSIVFSKAQ